MRAALCSSRLPSSGFDESPTITRSKTWCAASAFAPQRLLLLALAIDAAGDLAQRQLAQRGQVAGLEKILECLLDLRRRVNFSFAQTLAKLLDRHIDVDDLVGLRDEGIGHHLAHLDAGDAPHQRIERFDVLDVDRGDDADAVRDQLLDVLVALLVPGAGGVGMRELIDDRDLGLARDDRVDIHLIREWCRDIR